MTTLLRKILVVCLALPLMVSGIVMAVGARPAHALDNGLALTPPMGWNSWNHVRCKGLNEDVVKAAADTIVERGLKDVGYSYVVVDDCWQAGRDADGVLYADTTRFPSGMEALIDYVHSKGLKFGIYAVPGSQTCANYWDSYPVTGIGSYGHEARDAETFAKWGVDYLKYDWCRADVTDGLSQQPAFEKMRDILAKQNRDIVYGISEYGVTKPWTWSHDVANLWRTTQDIQPTWASIVSIIDSQAKLAGTSSPGAFNDPDMLQIGNGSLTPAETRSHFAMWAMLAAPLFLGTDIAGLSDETVSVVANPRIIAIDQDPRALQARLVSSENGVEVWARPLADGDTAVAVLNKSAASATATVSVRDVVGQATERSYVVTDQWSGEAQRNATTMFPVTVAPHDTAVYRLKPGVDASLPGAVHASAAALALEPGHNAPLTVTVTNGSRLDRTNVSVVAAQAPGISAGEGETIGVLAAGESATVKLPISAAADASYGPRTLMLTVRDGEHANGIGDGSARVVVTPAPPASDTYASALTPIASSVGWGSVQVNKSVDGNALTVNGQASENGFGVHAVSHIDLWLGGRCTSLRGALAIDDETKGGSEKWGRPSITGTITSMSLSGETDTLWSSSGVIGYQQSQSFDLDVTGVQQLTLAVGDGGDGHAYDHADWLTMALTCSQKATATDIPTDVPAEHTVAVTAREGSTAVATPREPVVDTAAAGRAKNRLAATGVSVGLWGGVAAMAVLAGAVVLRVGRRGSHR